MATKNDNRLKINNNQFFDQQYYRRYGDNFTSSKRYINKKEYYDKRIKESNWFFGLDAKTKKNGNILSYMARKDSDIDTTPIEYYKALEKATSTGEGTRSALGYIKNRYGSIGFFDEEGSIDEEKAKKITEFMRTVPKVGWSNVLSPSDDVSVKCLTNSYDAQRLLKEIIPQQLKIQNLNPDDFYWFGAFHRNTEHPHIHYVIVPKKSYTNCQAFCPRDLNKQIHKFVNNYLNPDNLPFPIKRKEFFELLDESAKSSNTNRKLEKIILQKKQYARLTKQEKRLVNSYTWQAINKNPTLKKALLDIKEWGVEKQASIIAKKERQHEEITDADREFAEKSYYAFMNRVYNHAMKELQKDIESGVIEIRDNSIVINKGMDAEKTPPPLSSSPTTHLGSSKNARSEYKTKAKDSRLIKQKEIKRRSKRQELTALFRRSASAVLSASFDVASSMAQYMREYEREIEDLEAENNSDELELKNSQ